MHITVDTVVAGYNFLKATPPFRRWGLPDSDDIEFEITRSKSVV